MKNFYSSMTLVVTLLLLMNCCTNKQMELQKQRETFVADSLLNVHLEELSHIAWEEAKFGMTKEEVLSLKDFKGSSSGDNWVSMESREKNKLKEKLHLTNGIRYFELYFGYYNELHSLEIRSNNYRWEKLNKMISDCDAFVIFFSNKYTYPKYVKNTVTINNFDRGEEFVYARFQINKKVIAIHMGESDGYDPYYSVIIYRE